MKVALLVAPKDFRDESVSNLMMMLSKWGIDYAVTSYTTKDCVGYHGAVYRPSVNAENLRADDFDALVLVDGKGIDSSRLYDFRPLLDKVKVFSDRQKVIAAIDNSIKIISRANIIQNTKIAMPKDEEARRLALLYHAIASKSEVESDKNIVTLSNPDKILDFADALIRKLGAR